MFSALQYFIPNKRTHILVPFTWFSVISCPNAPNCPNCPNFVQVNPS